MFDVWGDLFLLSEFFRAQKVHRILVVKSFERAAIRRAFRLKGSPGSALLFLLRRRA